MCQGALVLHIALTGSPVNHRLAAAQKRHETELGDSAQGLWEVQHSLHVVKSLSMWTAAKKAFKEGQNQERTPR